MPDTRGFSANAFARRGILAYTQIANGGTAMDGPCKDHKDVDAHDGQSAAKERAPWQRPQWRKLDAGEAEAGFNAGPDIIFS
jgi:hypothetical protein